MPAPKSTDLPLHGQQLPAGAHAAEARGSTLPSGPSARPARPVAARSGAERVLDLARRRGRHGVHQTDFDAGWVVDGGRPIRRLAARIDELRNRRHWFNARRNRDRTTTYILVRDAATVELVLRQASEPERLFDSPPAPPVNAVHDWDTAA